MLNLNTFKSNTKLTILPTLCDTGKLNYFTQTGLNAIALLYRPDSKIKFFRMSVAVVKTHVIARFRLAPSDPEQP